MIITRHNCEAFFLDYYEKNLSPVEVAEVLFFLEENPDLKELFESYKSIFLKYEKVNFPNKEALKKKYNSEEIEAILSSEITHNNCEQFFIAHAEELLSLPQKEKLKQFLLQFPGRVKEFELLQQCKLSPDMISFEGKEALKKAFITNENREEYFIRSLEKELNGGEEEALKLFLQKNPELKKELDLFSKTRLPADKIAFDGKASLKKKEHKPVFVSILSNRSTYYAAAAVVLLLVGMFFFFRNNNNTETYFANQTNTPNKTRVNANDGNNKKANHESGQKTALQQNIFKKQKATSDPKHNFVKEGRPTLNKNNFQKEGANIQPFIFEDTENPLAEKDPEAPQLLIEEMVAVKIKNEIKPSEIKTNQVASVAANAKADDAYQTFGSFAIKKLKKALKINNANSCEAADKLSLWDLAMAAKSRVQSVIGTKAVDVNKVCDGKGDKVEYVFAAGNFEISKSASKQNRAGE